MFIAQKRLKVGDEYRDFGDPLPEAAEWPYQIRESYLRAGYLKEVPDSVSAASTPAVKGGKANGS